MLTAHLLRNIEAKRTPHAQLFVGKNGHGNLAIAMAYAQHLVALESLSKGAVEPLNHPDIHFYFPVVKREAQQQQGSRKTIFRSGGILSALQHMAI